MFVYVVIPFCVHSSGLKGGKNTYRQSSAKLFLVHNNYEHPPAGAQSPGAVPFTLRVHKLKLHKIHLMQTHQTSHVLQKAFYAVWGGIFEKGVFHKTASERLFQVQWCTQRVTWHSGCWRGRRLRLREEGHGCDSDLGPFCARVLRVLWLSPTVRRYER